jgi:RES domain-containing protein
MGSLSLRSFRLTASVHPKVKDAFSGKGGLHGAGRWHSRGSLVVYASQSIALAYLEILAHFASDDPVIDLLLFEIEIPDSLVRTLAQAPRGWDSRPASPISQKLGDEWLRSKESAALRVPSVIVSSEWNVLINPSHPAFSLRWAVGPRPFPHDPRLSKKAGD